MVFILNGHWLLFMSISDIYSMLKVLKDTLNMEREEILSSSGHSVLEYD